MPPTGAADPGQASIRAMQWVKNRNNIIDNYLKKQVEQYEREKDLSISVIDQDRLDIHDFLKQLKKCDSDNLPEAKHWLGERTQSGKRLPPKARQIYTAPAVLSKEEQEPREIKTAPERREEPRYDFHFRSRPKPEMVQRSTTLYSLFMRRNEMVSVDHPTWDTETKHADDESQEGDERPASVTFEDERENDEEGIVKKGRDYERERAEILRLGKTGASVFGAGKLSKETGDLMKDILVKKYKKTKKHRVPFEDRLANFYQSVDEIRVEQEKDQTLSEWETKRRWTVLTKGVRAALAESSDEEENPNAMLHTV